MQCQNCGFEDEGKYCSNCGSPLQQSAGPGERDVAPTQGLWYETCPACNSNPLSKAVSKGFLGLRTKETYSCPTCGAVFTPVSSSTFKLSRISDTSNPVWSDYGNQVLKDEEWRRIAYGGASDVKQRELDLNYMLEKFQKGYIPQLNCAPNSVVLKKGERLVAAILGVTLNEPRSVRTTSGGGAGPSFRIAKGVYFRTAGFAARSESHEEIRAIDSGTLTLTNKRMVFSGQKRTISLNLGKIVSMKPFKNEIAVNREGKQRTEYYSGLNKTVLTIGVEGRWYNEPLSGVMFMCMVQGLLNNE